MFQDCPRGQGIRQGAVGAGAVDLQDIRNGLQAVRGKVEMLACQLERVDHFHRGKLVAETIELAADEGQVKGGVVADEDGILQPKAHLRSDPGEKGCIRQVYFGQAIHAGRAGRERPFGVDQCIESIEDGIPLGSQDGDLADAVSEPGREAGGFDIQEGQGAGSQFAHLGYTYRLFG